MLEASWCVHSARHCFYNARCSIAFLCVGLFSQDLGNHTNDIKPQEWRLMAASPTHAIGLVLRHEDFQLEHFVLVSVTLLRKSTDGSRLDLYVVTALYTAVLPSQNDQRLWDLPTWVPGPPAPHSLQQTGLQLPSCSLPSWVYKLC